MSEEVIAIEGGHKLNGTVTISGAKNATVALIPSIVLSDEPVEIYNVPEISDVDALTVLLEELNCVVERDMSVGEIGVDPRNMKNIPLVSDAVDKLRASYYFMGALLGKYKEVTIRMPGGCYLGPRPIDLHLKGFEALGADINYDEETGTYHLRADELIGTEIYLDFASVGATINIMLAAVKAKGRTVIENAFQSFRLFSPYHLSANTAERSAVRSISSSVTLFLRCAIVGTALPKSKQDNCAKIRISTSQNARSAKA